MESAKTDLSFRSLSNLRNQRVEVEELRVQCEKRGWFVVEASERVLVAKSEAAKKRVLGNRVAHVQYDPNELPSNSLVPEGARLSVVVNRYERSTTARASCIAHWGLDCVVCGFNFEREFGSRGEGFIHVHHLKPLSEIGDEYQLDPIKDLRPVCPNCHSMLHASTPAASIEELIAARRSRGDG
ncbi:MAG: HNH endonuclease [Burkholderiales bacterium]|nr:HNH endonuclease [Burkholderiales bacterium]